MNKKNNINLKQNLEPTNPHKQLKTAVITEEEKSSNPVLNSVYKKIRNLKKKLLNIEQLEKQPVEKLKQQQKQKIERKQDTIHQIKKNQEFVIQYKSVLLQTGGQFYDPTEILTKISTLLTVGQYVDRNKGLLFKADLSNDFKACYQNFYKQINHSTNQFDIVNQSASTLAILSQFIKNQKIYQNCKQFISYALNEKKQQQKVKQDEKKTINHEIKEQQDLDSKRKLPAATKKYTTKASWVSSDEQQQEQNITPVIKHNETKLEYQQLKEQKAGKQDLIITEQKIKESPQKEGQQIKNIQNLDITENPKQSIILEVKQKDEEKQTKYQKNNNYKYKNYKDNKFSERERGYYQKQRKYNNQQQRNHQNIKIYNDEQQKRYYQRQLKFNNYQQRGYQNQRKFANQQYKSKYPSHSENYYDKNKNKYTSKQQKYKYDEEDYHKPRENDRKRYQHVRNQNQHRYNQRLQRRRDSDTSLDSTPEKLHNQRKKQKNTQKYQNQKRNHDYTDQSYNRDNRSKYYQNDYRGKHYQNRHQYPNNRDDFYDPEKKNKKYYQNYEDRNFFKQDKKETYKIKYQQKKY